MKLKKSFAKLLSYTIEIISNKKFLTRQAFFISNSVVIAWLLKDIFTAAIFNRSFAGRSFYIQLIIFFGITVFTLLLIILVYRFYQKAQNKITFIYILYLYQIVILLAAYMTIIFNFELWIYDVAGFFLFFLLNLIISTTLFFNQRNLIFGSNIKLSKRPIHVIVVIIFLIFLEIFILNQGVVHPTFQILPEIQYEVREGTLSGFSLINGNLRSKHNDPNITFSNIDKRVRFIKVQCTNPNPDALSQVYYRRDYEDFSEEKSITFPLSNDGTIISLPRAIIVSSLRFDLTNVEGDTLFCEGITLNPRFSYIPNYPRLSVFGFIILGFYFGDRLIKPKTSNKLKYLFINNGLWIFILLIIMIGFTYPVTITFDSAHYLWLADLIRQGDWANWDLIRYPGFPMIIFISTSIFGLTQNALLIPMIIAQVLLFIFTYQIIVILIRPNHYISRFIIALIVFLVVGLDPTVMGYYHTLLTEYAATTLAIISVYLSIKLYKTPFLSKPFIIITSFFIFLVPIAWHLKQPYIGAALFPLIIVSTMIMLRHFSWKTIIYFFTTNLVILSVVFISTRAWYGFLQARGNPMREERQITKIADDMLFHVEHDYTTEGPQTYLINKFIDYLAISNYYHFDFNTLSVIRTPSLQRANENAAIAHRMFTNPGGTNVFYSFYPHFTYHFQTTYAPPSWVNDIFLNRILLSNSIFTITFLFLPFFVMLMLFLWIKSKSFLNAGLLILSASSLLNALGHLFLAPNDRYLLWGYVLNLLMLIILSLYILNEVIRKTIGCATFNPDSSTPRQ